LLLPASIRIQNGRIIAISGYDEIPRGCLLETVGENSIVMPGLVDAHVHINEPGRSEWEGFFTATRAAAAGGVTTLVDMPLNSIPPTTSVPVSVNLVTPVSPSTLSVPSPNAQIIPSVGHLTGANFGWSKPM